MRTKSFLLMLLLLVMATTAWADKYYQPTTRTAELTPGTKYMIYNTTIVVDPSQDRTGFLYNTGTGLGLNKNKKRSEHIYNDCHVWTLEQGAAEGTYYFKSQSTGTYLAFNGNTTNAEGQPLYIVDWSTAKTTLTDELAGVSSENEAYETISDITTENDKVFLVHNNSGSTWNGNQDSFTTWDTGHPYAFYEVQEVTQETYTNISLLHIYSRCDLYSVQKIYGYIQMPSQITSNMTYTAEGGYENLLDGDYGTYNVTNWGNNSSEVFHYYQVDLGVSVEDLHIYMKRRSDGNNAPTVLTLSMSADGNNWVDYTGGDIATGLGSNVEFFSDNIEFGGEYRYLRFTAKERSNTLYMCMGLSEFYLLPHNAVTESGSLDYFDNTLPVSATAAGYDEVLATRETNAPGVKLLSGVPLPGYKYHIYADAYDASTSLYVNRDVNVVDGALLASNTYTSIDNSFVWVCEDLGNGKLAFKNESTNKYLANGTLQDVVYAWTYNTCLTHRHGVPLLDDNGNYLAVKNDGTAWVAGQTAVANQTEGENCYDFVFLPYEFNENEKALTISLCAAPLAVRNSTFTVNGVAQTFPYSYICSSFTMPEVASVCPEYYEFVGYFKGEENLGTTLNFEDIESGDNIEARFAIVAPFEYTTDTSMPKYYRIKNVRQNKYAKYAGNSAAMTQVTDATTASLFYFTGEATANAYVAKIHNAKTTNIVDGIKNWNATGRNYYVQPYKLNNNNKGYAITYTELNETNNPYTAWNDLTGSTVTEYNAIDAGSTWLFEPVTDFSPYAEEAKAETLAACEAFIELHGAFFSIAEREALLAEVNGLAMAGTTQESYNTFLARLETLRASWAVNSVGFPKLSTAEDIANNTMKWYTIDNVRAKKGNAPYLSNFTGEASAMSQVTLPATPSTMFYFTGDEVTENGITYLQNVKIHTHSTDKVAQAPGNWNATGTSYFIQEYNRTGYEGYVIATSKYADPAITLDAANTTIAQIWTNAPSPWGTTDEATYPSELTVADGTTVRKAETTLLRMAPGTLTITFTYSTGAHKLTILGVELLNADGTVVDSDYHTGTTGTAHSANSYTLDVTSTAQYKLRYWVNNVQGDSEVSKTNGNIAIATTSTGYFLASSSTGAQGWSDHGGNASNLVANYNCNDDGSTWQFTAVKNFAEIFDVETKLNDAINDVAVYEVTSNIVSNEANNEQAAEYEAQLQALLAEYENAVTDKTYAECNEVIEQIETIREAYSALFVATKTLEFTQTRDEVAYWLTATSAQSVATQAANLHTNAWRIDHVGSGLYTIYNEASNKYLAKAADNTQSAVLALTDAVGNAGTWKFVNDESGNLLIVSGDRDDTYLCIAADNKNVKATSDKTLARAHWNMTVTDNVTIEEELYTKAAQVVWNKMTSINENFGLVSAAQMYSSNVEAAAGSLAALLDDDVTTSFLSATGENAVYLQADLGENNGVESLYAYMRARAESTDNRPIAYTVQAANSADFSDAVTIGEYKTNLNNMSIDFSGIIGEGNTTAYRYWRFTFNTTNTGTNVVGLSEFMLLQNIDFMNTFVPAVNEFYDTKLCDNDTEGYVYDNDRTITSASIKLLKADIFYYLERFAGSCASYDEMTVGQFDKSDYNALQAAYDACNASNWATMYEKLDLFLASYNGPVYYVHSAFEDGYTHDRAITYGEITQTGTTSTKDHLRYLSKWDYEQLYYTMPTREYVDITDPEVAATTLVPDFRHYKTNRKFMGRDYVEFIPIEGWDTIAGYTRDIAYKIDTNNENDSTYIDVAERGLALSEAHKKNITAATNRQGAWYITYVCDRKHLTQLYNVKMQYDLDGDGNAEEVPMLDVINEIYNQWRILHTRIENDANGDVDGLNKYYWHIENGENYTVERRTQVYTNAQNLLQAQFHHIATRVLEKEDSDPNYYPTQFTTMLTNLKLMIANYTMNQPKTGRYYRFRGIDENGNKRDKYMTSKVNNSNRFVVDSELNDDNAASTIFYFHNESKNHLLSYEEGRFVGISHGNVGYGDDNWNFEKIGEVFANIPPASFVGSVNSPASMAYSIKSGNVYLYCRDAYVDRGNLTSQADADYWRYDWAVEQVNTLPVEFGSLLVTSLYVPVELQIPAGVTAYTLVGEVVATDNDINLEDGSASEVGEVVFRLRPIKGDVLPAATPVIVKAVAKGVYDFSINYEPTITTDEQREALFTHNEGESNILDGTHETTCVFESDGITHYILSNGTKGVGMYKVTMVAGSSRNDTYADAVKNNERSSFRNKAHRAYLPLSSAVSIAAYKFAITHGNQGGTTGIEEIEDVDAVVNGNIYDLNGRPVLRIAEPGVYIVNGKKVIVK